MSLFIIIGSCSSRVLNRSVQGLKKGKSSKTDFCELSLLVWVGSYSHYTPCYFAKYTFLENKSRAFNINSEASHLTIQ